MTDCVRERARTKATQETDENRSATLLSGQDLLKRIRAQYASDDRPYQAFLQTLIKFRNKQFSAEEVVQKCVVVRVESGGASSLQQRELSIVRAHVVIV